MTRLGPIPNVAKEYFTDTLSEKLKCIARKHGCQLQIKPIQQVQNIYELFCEGPEEKQQMVYDISKKMVKSIKIIETEWISKSSKLGRLLTSNRFEKEIKQLQEENQCYLKTIFNCEDDK